jgi:predicted nucleic acid-binding protein
MECRVKPLRSNDSSLLAIYDDFFDGTEISLLELTPDVLEKATAIRAHLNFKTPDAIHLASAIIARTKTFLTGDKALSRCTEIAVEVL